MATFKGFTVTETVDRVKGRDYPVLEVTTRAGETVRLRSTPKGNKLTLVDN